MKEVIYFFHSDIIDISTRDGVGEIINKLKMLGASNFVGEETLLFFTHTGKTHEGTIVKTTREYLNFSELEF